MGSSEVRGLTTFPGSGSPNPLKAMGPHGKNQVIITSQFEVDTIVGIRVNAVKGVFARPNDFKAQ
jgi:hypothetical protein